MGSTGINVALASIFGLRLVSDIPERMGDLRLPPFVDAKRRQRLEAIRRAGVLFIHVPKNAGMAISSALYDQQVKHASVRYYARVAPDLLRDLETVAVVRDPVDRFLSAFDYARAGGSCDNRVSAPFRRRYMAFGSVDDALDHVESAASPYHMDHIFRPQTWYVADAQGAVRVKRLLRFERLAEAEVMPGWGGRLACVNRRLGLRTEATASQILRIRRFYRDDLRLQRLCAPAVRPVHKGRAGAG